MKRADAAFDNDRALASNHSFMNPALGALPVADHPPVLELSDDLDGHVLAGQHPVDRVVLPGTDPEVGLVRAQADKARHFLVRLAFSRGSERRAEDKGGQKHPQQARSDCTTLLSSRHSTLPLANGGPRLLWTFLPCGRNGHS